MLLNSNDKSIISSQELNRHNMARYEFKKLNLDEMKEINTQKKVEIE